MTYIKDICRTFNFTYLEFLEDNLFKTKAQTEKERVGENSLKIILANEKDYEDRLRSDCLEFSPFNDEKYQLSKQDFKESFYLGHLELSSLWQTSQGQNLVFDILAHRVQKIHRILNKYEEIKKEIKNNYDEDFYFNNIDEKINSIIKVKLFKTYQDYLNLFNDNFKKNDKKNIHFFNTHKANKEDYIKHILSINSPTQTFYKKKLQAYIPNKARYKHTYITAGTGGGKSELMKGLIYTVLLTQKYKDKSKRENFILLEPHSDLSTQVFNLCSNLKADTVILDPFLDNDLTPIINPFDFEGTEKELDSYSEELLAVFKEVLGAEFTLNAEALLMPCISTLLKIPNTSLYDLQTFMNDEENQELVKRGAITKNFAHKNFFETNFYSSNLNSTKRAVFLKLQTLLNNKTFSNLTTGETTLDIEKIMNNGTNLIIKLNKKKMKETIKPFGRFIISKVQSVALNRAELKESQRPKTHLFIDEFQNFITPTVEEILTESRKYKLFLTMAHQVVTQLEESKLKDIILSNTNIKIVGKNGIKTLKILSSEIGVKFEDMQGLKVGEFYGKIGNSTAFKFYHRLVEFHFFDFGEHTKKNLEENKKLYYVKPTARKVILKSDKKKDFVNSVIKDKKDHLEQEEEQTQAEPTKKARKPKFDNF